MPTRNRAHTLALVAPSYFTQEGVSEILFVDDHGDDDTAAVIAEIARSHPEISCQVVRNPERRGASQSRNVGAAIATGEYVLFCDDDEYLEPGYARICREKLEALGAGAISGRRVYMLDGETPEEALRRFGHGLRGGRPFNRVLCEVANGARFEGDLRMPFTNAIILTRRSLLLRYPFDGHYARGNGYREETDFQMNLFVNGYDIYVTNDCHSIHLPMSQVRTGGQRVRRFHRIYWSVHYTRYFFDKYYERYAARERVSVPKQVALPLYALYATYRELLRPTLYTLAMTLSR
ncbi:MAG TPA: glycosyltransferase family 2 protein [Stellaceae bacterium]|nr:glycosyltransferase family 2 protein [Stellaceae bacterium]